MQVGFPLKEKFGIEEILFFLSPAATCKKTLFPDFRGLGLCLQHGSLGFIEYSGFPPSGSLVVVAIWTLTARSSTPPVACVAMVRGARRHLTE